MVSGTSTVIPSISCGRYTGEIWGDIGRYREIHEHGDPVHLLVRVRLRVRVRVVRVVRVVGVVGVVGVVRLRVRVVRMVRVDRVRVRVVGLGW